MQCYRSFVSVVELDFAFHKLDLITSRRQAPSGFTLSGFGAMAGSAEGSSFFGCSLTAGVGIQVPRGFSYHPGPGKIALRVSLVPLVQLVQSKSQGERSEEGAE